MKQEIKDRIEKIKNGEVPRGYKSVKFNIIPETWENPLIDKECKRFSGHTPDKKITEYWNGDIPWISLKDTNKLDNLYIENTVDHTSLEGIENSSAVLLPKGTIVISRDATVGKIGIMNKEMATSQHFVNYTCGDNVDNLYLYYYLLSRKKDFKRIAVGSTIVTIGLNYFKKLRIILPSLLEQQKIAKILSTWDKAIELKEELIKQKKEQKKGLMQNLLTGKKRLPGFEGEWKEVRLNEVLSFVKKEPVVNPEKYNLLTVKLHLKGIEATDKKPNITKKGRPYYLREPNEILIGRQNFHNGGIGLVSKNMTNYIASNAISSLSVKDGDLKFLYYYISNNDFYKKVGHIVGGTGQKEISESMMKNLKLNIPSLQTQKEISKILTNADKEISLLEKELEALKTQKKGLMQLLLTGIVRVQD